VSWSGNNNNHKTVGYAGNRISGPEGQTKGHENICLHAHVDKLARHKKAGEERGSGRMKYKRASFVWLRWKFTQFHQGN